jgi:HD-like signal output (HDOD) protein
MFRWLQQLFSSPAPAPQAAQPVTPPTPPLPAADAAPAIAAPAGQHRRPPVSFEQRDRINSGFRGWLFGRNEDGGLDISAAEERVLAALAAILESRQSGAALVRRMPGLIPQLLQSLRSETFSGAALARTISSDVVLVAAVVRLANGALQGSGAAISSVENAVIVIGQNGLRQLITSVAFRPIIDINSGYYTRTLAPRLWEHAERCAGANRSVAEELGVDPFEAFLAGLVQHAGLIVALRVIDQVAGDDQGLGSELFWARLVRDARQLACSIGREWHFPDSVITALAEQDGMRKGAQLSPLGGLLMLSDYLGKGRMLLEQGALRQTEAVLFAGLPPHAARCDAALAAPAAEPVA